MEHIIKRYYLIKKRKIIFVVLLSSLLLLSNTFSVAAYTEIVGNTKASAYTFGTDSSCLSLFSKDDLQTTDQTYTSEAKYGTLVDFHGGSPGTGMATMDHDHWVAISNSKLKLEMSNTIYATHVKKIDTDMRCEVMIKNKVDENEDTLENDETVSTLIKMRKVNSASLPITTATEHPSPNSQLELTYSYSAKNSVGNGNGEDNLCTNNDNHDNGVNNEEQSNMNDLIINGDNHVFPFETHENGVNNENDLIITGYKNVFSFETFPSEMDLPADVESQNLDVYGDMDGDIVKSFGYNYASYVKANGIECNSVMVFNMNP